jgi:hypothetical protein
MLEPTLYFYLFLFFLLMFFGAVFKIIALRKENNLLAEQLTETTVSLERTRHNLAILQEKHEKIVEFQNNLGEAERTKKLHKPQLSPVHFPERPRNSPERYTFIHSLAEKGLSADEIASILTISTHEARQLVALSKIAQGN